MGGFRPGALTSINRVAVSEPPVLLTCTVQRFRPASADVGVPERAPLEETVSQSVPPEILESLVNLSGWLFGSVAPPANVWPV